VQSRQNYTKVYFLGQLDPHPQLSITHIPQNYLITAFLPNGASLVTSLLPSEASLLRTALPRCPAVPTALIATNLPVCTLARSAPRAVRAQLHRTTLTGLCTVPAAVVTTNFPVCALLRPARWPTHAELPRAFLARLGTVPAALVAAYFSRCALRRPAPRTLLRRADAELLGAGHPGLPAIAAALIAAALVRCADIWTALGAQLKPGLLTGFLLFRGLTEELDAPLTGGRADSTGGVAAGFAEGAAVGPALGTSAGRNAGNCVVDDDAFEAAGTVDQGTVRGGVGGRGRGP